MSRDVHQPPDIYQPPDVDEPPPPAPSRPEMRSSPGPGKSVSPEAWKSIGIGAVIALVVFLIPFTRFVFNYLNTLAHELGHSVIGWGFGYPSIPAFDWRYGGGITHTGHRNQLLLLLCFAAVAYLIFQLRESPRLRNVAIGLGAFYTIAAFTPIHEILHLAMGHGMELIIAGIFLYRAVSGSAVVHGVERPLYAACAFFLLIENLRLSWGLMFDVDARTAYGMAKGGGHWMDMSRLAREYLGMPLGAVASFLCLGVLVTPVLSYWAYLNLGDD